MPWGHVLPATFQPEFGLLRAPKKPTFGRLHFWSSGPFGGQILEISPIIRDKEVDRIGNPLFVSRRKDCPKFGAVLRKAKSYLKLSKPFRGDVYSLPTYLEPQELSGFLPSQMPSGHGKQMASVFGWSTLKGNPSQKEKTRTTGQLGDCRGETPPKPIFPRIRVSHLPSSPRDP